MAENEILKKETLGGCPWLGKPVNKLMKELQNVSKEVNAQ